MVRQNAVKHGILARETLLPDEDEADLVALAESLWSKLEPEGDLEALLVDRIISITWRLRRVVRVEAGMFVWRVNGALAHRVKWAHFDDTPRAAVAFRAQQRSETATLGEVFIDDAKTANAFGKLSRYEVTLERSLYRALHELQRLQAARGGEHVPVPHVVDITIADGSS